MAGKSGASEAVKRMLVEGCREVLEGATLVQAIEGSWGAHAVGCIIAADPEVSVGGVDSLSRSLTLLRECIPPSPPR